MSSGAGSFRTFCHISEYGTEGYKRLDQLVAASDPLVLWAPSSAIIDSSDCPLSAQEFVDLVTEGRIRVLGRAAWFEEDSRKYIPWAGARWVPKIDEPLARMRSIYDTASIPRDERHVANGDAEYGWTWAQNFFSAHSAKVTELRAAFLGPDAADHFPKGVVEAAARGVDEDDAMKLILKDAYNHHAALRNADTRVPFLLAKREALFNQILEDVLKDVAIPFDPNPSKKLATSDLVTLTTELLDVLGRFDAIRSVPLTSFVRSEGHAMLTTWLGGVYEKLVNLGATDTSGYLLDELREHMADGGTDIDWGNVLLGVGGTGLLDLGVSVTDFIKSSHEILGFVGLGLGAIPIGYELAKQLSLAPTRFEGNPWPFLYTFGDRPNRRRHKQITQALI